VRSMARQTWFVLVAALAVSACGSEEREGPTYTVRDSAGITIVESAEPSWEEGEGWTLTPEPILDIGEVEGEAAYQFFRILDLARFPGAIAVANAGSQEVRVFDGEGRFLRSIGGRGEGPGEFSSLGAVYRFRGDSLLTYDFSGRITVFDLLGNMGRTLALTPPGGGMLPTLAGPLEGGSFLVIAIANIQPDAGVGVHRQEAQVLRYDTDGGVSQLITPLHMREFVLMDTERGLIGAIRAFTPDGWAKTNGDLVYVGDSVRDEIRVFGSDGTLVRILRRTAPLRTVTPEIIADYSSAQLEDVPDEARASREAILENMPYPETLPAYGRLHLAPDGSLWAHVEPLPGDSTAAYSVFDPDGAWVGEVAVPVGFRALRMGDDYILGVATDEFDVEHVRMYGLVR